MAGEKSGHIEVPATEDKVDEQPTGITIGDVYDRPGVVAQATEEVKDLAPVVTEALTGSKLETYTSLSNYLSKKVDMQLPLASRIDGLLRPSEPPSLPISSQITYAYMPSVERTVGRIPPSLNFEERET